MATIDTVTECYCTKHNITHDKLSELDLKIIKGILKVKLSYAEQLEKRRCTILLDKPPQSYDTKPLQTLTEQPKVPKVPKTTKAPKGDAEIAMCKAVTMKGTACKAKAKPGCEFCGKHLPK